MPIIVSPSVSSSSGYVDVTELVRRVRILLEDYPQKDKLANGSALTSGTTTFTTEQNSTLWTAGRRGEFEDATFEQYLTRSAVAGSITVQRGVYGTTASSHDDGTYILHEPRFGGQQISDALTSAIRWMSGWVWTSVQVFLTPSTTTTFYSVPAGFLGWVSVTQPNATNTWTTEYGVRKSGLPVKIRRGVDVLISSTGIALQIPTLINFTEYLVLTYGVTPTVSTITAGPMEEAVIYGACASLLGAKDAPRTGQDISQGGGVTPPGATIQTASWFLNEFTQYRRQARMELEASGTLHRD